MSVGHQREYRHKAGLIAETQKLLRDSRIQAYLKRPFKINLKHHIPYTGGSSRDGLTYYLDKDLPDVFHVPVLWHERIEKALRDVLKMSYSRAHELATCAERMLVDRMGQSWSEYKEAIGEYVRSNMEHPAKNLPDDLDTGPYRESGQMKLLGSAVH
jgi:hypothetical protein